MYNVYKYLLNICKIKVVWKYFFFTFCMILNKSHKASSATLHTWRVRYIFQVIYYTLILALTSNLFGTMMSMNSMSTFIYMRTERKFDKTSLTYSLYRTKT